MEKLTNKQIHFSNNSIDLTDNKKRITGLKFRYILIFLCSTLKKVIIHYDL